MEFVWNAQTTEKAAGTRRRRKAASTRISEITVENADEHFCYIQEFKVLICRKHNTAVQSLEKHLRTKHSVTVAERRAITEKYSTLWIKKPEEVALPPSIRHPFQVLGTPLDAFQCEYNDCTHITKNFSLLKAHCYRRHNISWLGDTETLFKKVKVQTFFNAGGLQRYFVVHALEESRASVSDGEKAEVDTLLSEWKSTQERHEAEMQVMDAEIAKTDKTGWFNRTGWPQHFAKRNLKHLAHAIRLPDRDETKLHRAAHAVELLIEQSVAGLSTLGRETRRWLRSAQREEVDQRPLARLQNPESQATYAAYYVKFVCYFLRIIADEERRAESSSDSSEDETISSSSSSSSSSDQSRSRMPDLLKDAREIFPWQGRQKELGENLWQVLDENDEKTAVNALLQVLASFVLTKTGDDPFSSGLIHFLAVLGIDAEMERLRTAKNYSYMLAGVVYCTRVIAAETLLPSAEREQQSDEHRNMFILKRREYLADGSFSPMSEMLSLLAYGKHVAMNAGNSGNAFWSKDKKIFHLNGRPIHISRFQQMAQDVITEAEDMLWQDLFWMIDQEERFIVKLDKIVDDVTFTKRGISFVSAEENGLKDGLQWMLSRVMQSTEGRKFRSKEGAWNIKKVRQYLRRIDRFLELALFGVHVASGQPGRGTEITTIRHKNSMLQDRNIFVVDGQVMTVVRYHKSQSQWDKPKVVPRFLPWRLGQVMAMYLAYLQPFHEYLTVQVLGGGFDEYVWADQHGPWDTGRLTRIISRETAKRLGVKLTTLDYRHTAVGIGRVLVGEAFGRGYEDEIGEIEEVEIDEEGESALELQSARTTKMGLGNYSVSVDIVKHLSIRSMETFRPLSELWHRFLGLASTQQQEMEAKSKSSSIKRLEVGRKHEREDEALEHKQEAPVGPIKRARIEQGKQGVHNTMQQILGKSDISFKSLKQEEAIYAVIRGQTPLVVVLPTGGGKSLLFMVPALLDGTEITIVVVPYRALIDDLVDRIRSSGIDCIEWKPGQANPATIVVVSADVAGGASFLKYASLMGTKKLLRRVVIDECHLVFTLSDWRPRLAALRNLRVLGCPIVLLTATLPPVFEQELNNCMQIRCATYIRASTVRSNIRYVVSWCSRGEIEDMALATCRRQQQRLNGGRKGVVYCSSKLQCEAIAKELGCGYYHAGEVDRADRLAEWAEHGGFIVATSALGTGVDFPGVIFILHVGMPWSMIDYAQESGRGGRAGETVDSVILVEEGEVEYKLDKRGESIDVHAIGLFINSQGCRRGLMSEYLDGERVECGDIESVGCDRCGEGLIEWQEANTNWAREWEKVQMTMDELADGCGVCGVVGDALGPVNDDSWTSHRSRECKKYQGLSGDELDAFRRLIHYTKDSHSCTKCGISQIYCATKEDIRNKCQWPNVLIPVVRTAVMLAEGIEIVRRVGYKGELSGDFREYARWLAKRHGSRVWGEFFSNAMVVFIRVILWLESGSV
jgi:superfamily II DNA or RNA helicase